MALIECRYNGSIFSIQVRSASAFGFPAGLDCFALRTPVAFAQESSGSISQTGAETIQGGGLSGIIALRRSNKSKKFPAILGQQMHENFREAVAQLDGIARFMERSACPKMLDLIFIPELMVFLREFVPNHRWFPSADDSPIR